MFKDSVVTDPSKLQAITDSPVLRNVKELRGFLGFIGYYKKFVLGYRKIWQPLYNLTKKDGFY